MRNAEPITIGQLQNAIDELHAEERSKPLESVLINSLRRPHFGTADGPVHLVDELSIEFVRVREQNRYLFEGTVCLMSHEYENANEVGLARWLKAHLSSACLSAEVLGIEGVGTENVLVTIRTVLQDRALSTDVTEKRASHA